MKIERQVIERGSGGYCTNLGKKEEKYNTTRNKQKSLREELFRGVQEIENYLELAL